METFRLLDRRIETFVEIVPDEDLDHVVLDGHLSLGGVFAEPVEKLTVYPQAEHLRCHTHHGPGGAGVTSQFYVSAHPYV